MVLFLVSFGEDSAMCERLMNLKPNNLVIMVMLILIRQLIIIYNLITWFHEIIWCCNSFPGDIIKTGVEIASEIGEVFLGQHVPPKNSTTIYKSLGKYNLMVFVIRIISWTLWKCDVYFISKFFLFLEVLQNNLAV